MRRSEYIERLENAVERLEFRDYHTSSVSYDSYRRTGLFAWEGEQLKVQVRELSNQRVVALRKVEELTGELIEVRLELTAYKEYHAEEVVLINKYSDDVERLTKERDDMDQARADSELKNISLTWRVTELRKTVALLKRLLADSDGETL